MARTVTHTDAGTLFGDTPFNEVAASRSFVSIVFELISEREPTTQELVLFELILNLSIDHGPDAPSAQATIERAQTGEHMGSAVGEGIAEINDVHGGAQNALMEILFQIDSGTATPASIVTDYKAAGKRLPGYGHRIYSTDPRTTQIFAALEGHDLATAYRKNVEAIQTEIISQLGKQLPINIDGAIAVVLASFGWPASYGSAVFIIARAAGLCGHYINNRKTS